MTKSFASFASQLAGIWKQLGLNQRVSLVVAALVVAGGLVGMSLWASRPDYSLLYGRLDDAEAGRVTAALADAKVPYRVGAHGAIYVPADRVHAVRMQLATKGIPKGDGVGFEIFDKPTFGISDFVQRANYLRAVQGELARTISQLDEVEAARVMIVQPENRLLTDSQRKPTASVFVRLRGPAELSPSAVQSIRFLVANSVEGLQPSAVTVVDNRGRVLSGEEDENSVAGLSASQLNSRRAVEHYLAQKVQGMLERVLGPGQAIVRVAVEVNTETINRTEERYDPDGQVARSTTATEETSQSSNPVGGGVAGVMGGLETNAVAATTSSTTRRKTTTSQFEINRTVSTILQAPGGLKRVSAAVFVASRYEGTGANRQPVPRSPEELEKLRKIVRSALGLRPDDPERQDEITLEEMPFTDPVPVEVVEQLQKQQTTAFWWDVAKQTGYVLLAVGIAVLFLRLFKQTSAEAERLEAAATQPDNDTVTVEMLNRLIRENPATTHHAVRAWIHRGTTPTHN